MSEAGHHHNPVARIHQLCRPLDFCAFKLDIDTPWVEMPVVEQLLENPGNLKEFFFEHHVVSPVMSPWWARGGPGAMKGTTRDSYEIFTKLRQKGVRSHSWI